MRHNDSTNYPNSSKHTFRSASRTTWNEEAFDHFDLWWRIVNILQTEDKVDETLPIPIIIQLLNTNFVSECNGHYGNEKSK